MIGLVAVISRIQLLARQGIPLRGHGEEKTIANILQEVKLICSFSAEVQSYFDSSGTSSFLYQYRMNLSRCWVTVSWK